MRNGERALYLLRGDGTAFRYRIAVGRNAMQWKGYQQVIDMQKRPAWSPPAIIRAAQPNLPDVIPGGAHNNPMGEAAIVWAMNMPSTAPTGGFHRQGGLLWLLPHAQ